MRTEHREAWNWEDWLDLGLGVVVFLSPWALGYAGSDQPGAAGASWSAWLTGPVIAATSLASLIRFDDWAEWVNVLLGVWLIVAAWVLGFTGIATATASHIILGALVAALAAWELWREYNPAARHSGT
jgi:hypothetical protein